MYPQITDYNEAVQHPETAFTDPQLRESKIATTGLGLPLALSGGFALTYDARSNSQRYAIRCFHRQVPAVEKRYSRISTVLRQAGDSYFVPFEFQAEGIRVRGKSYPIVRMDWAEGQTLGQFIEKYGSNKTQIGALRDAFRQMSTDLERLNIAHGDLQNGNVIVTASGVRLIDYDGLFVPGMKQGDGSETGHKHFQHPRRTVSDFGPTMDRFAFIVIDLSLCALIEDPSLLQRYRGGGETILFRANDFADPGSSDLFYDLQKLSPLADRAGRLASICEGDLVGLPSLEQFLALSEIISRREVRPGSSARVGPTASHLAYVGPYAVFDATEHAKVRMNVGNRVEVVGKVYEMRKAKTVHGTGYVFVNFGPWKNDIVRLTIWAKALGRFHVEPDDSWIGKYVSVTGLVDAPFTNKRYGYTHLGINVADPSEVQFISEEEAEYRLGRKAKPKQVRKDSPSNKAVLDALKIRPRHAQRPAQIPVQLSASSGLSANRGIAASVKVRSISTPVQPPTSQPMAPPSSSPTRNRTIIDAIAPTLVWALIVLVLLRVCASS